MAYQPIQNYGLIGDLHTAALVGNGWVDRLALFSEFRLSKCVWRHP